MMPMWLPKIGVVASLCASPFSIHLFRWQSFTDDSTSRFAKTNMVGNPRRHPLTEWVVDAGFRYLRCTQKYLNRLNTTTKKQPETNQKRDALEPKVSHGRYFREC